LYGNSHAVSSGHYLASEAAFCILEAGGNAVDAGCCAGIALGVLRPHVVNFAGVAPIMIRTGSGRAVTIAGLGHWPSRLPDDIFVDEHGATIPTGVLRTVVPAAPDAWITALRDFGTLSFGDVAAAAARIAREGFVVDENITTWIEDYEESYAQWPSNAEIFLPGGRPPAVGSRFVQTDLADTIQYMIDAERSASRKGRDAGLEAARAAFYCGEIAQAIVGYHEEHGGYLRHDDLASFRSRYEPVVPTRWRDVDVLTCGPWCQGPVLAESLQLLEAAGLSSVRTKDADYAHLLIEVLKRAFADREHRYGDPRFVDVGLDELLSEERARAWVAGIDPKRATPAMPEPLDGRPWAGPGAATLETARAGADTSYVCVIDKWGNAFSATPSDGSDDGPVIPGTGIVPSTRGSQSRPDPTHPSGVKAGKRPRLTPNPAMAITGDGSVLSFGCPGGDMQVQAMLQVFLNIFHFGMDVQEAIDAPRFSTWSFPNSFAPFEYLPNRVAVEARVPTVIVDDLRRRGHDVRVWSAFARKAAAVDAVLLDRSSGFLRAGADPREPAYALAR
jgi:gamma-glutamyltranspeptidase/glutathione hydrolase